MSQPGNLEAKRVALISLALAVFILGVYWPVGRFDFVNYDDQRYIRDNPPVAAGLTEDGVRWAFTSTYFNYWQPLTWLSHMVDCEFFGVRPGAHHLVNLLFHVANSLLLFLLLFRSTGSLNRSACVAALFALHPLQVEPVAWLAERKGLLSTFFAFLSILAYLRYAKTRSRYLYLLTACFFVLACMSKPIVVTLPFLLLLLDFWPLGRLRGGDRPATLGRLVIEKAPLFLVSGIASVITTWATRQSGNLLNLEAIPFGARLAKVPVSYLQYLSKTFWPQDLTVLYPIPPQWDPGTVGLSSLLVLVITIFALVQRRQRPYLLVGWLWFLGTLVPTLGIVAAGSQQSMADRFAYVPLIGIFVMLVWGVSDLVGSLSRTKDRATSADGILLKIMAAVGVIICAWLSSVQLPVWRDATSLWTHAIRVTKDNPNKNSNTHADLGLALLNLGQPAAATNHLAQAVATTPKFARAHATYARALVLLKAYPDAIFHGREALRLNRKDFITYHVVAKAYLATGLLDEARAHFSEALRLHPQFFQEHGDLALAMVAARRNEEAVQFLQEAVKADPDSAAARFQIASALAAQKDFRSAIDQYQIGLRLQPNSAGALNNLAWILATHADPKLRNGRDAVIYAERACEITRREQPVFLGTLAAAYAESGDFEKAVRVAQEAVTLARSKGQPELAARNEQLLAHYHSRNPWREPN